MKKRYYFTIICMFAFIIPYTKVHASNELKCTYSRSGQSTITIDLGNQQSLIGNGINISTINYDARTEASKGKYDIEITMDLTENKQQTSAKLINKSDSTTIEVVLSNASQTDVKAEMITTYSCPKYTLVAKSGNKVFASSNATAIYQLYSVNPNAYYIMQNTKQERNNNNMCFYHQEGLMTYMDEIEGGNTEYKKISLYVDINKDEMYYLDNNQQYKSSKINKDLKECPIAYSYEVSPRSFTEVTDQNIDKTHPSIVNLYKIDGNGNLVSNNLENIKQELKKYTDSFNNVNGNVDEKCKSGALTKDDFDKCYKMIGNQYNTNDTAIKEFERLIEFSLLSGLTEQSQEIIDARNALKNYKGINGQSSLKDELAKRIIHKSYCKYKSNSEDKYLIISKKAPETINWSDGGTSFDITSWNNSNPYKYYMYIYSDAAYSNEIGRYHEDLLKEQIENVCFGLDYKTILGSEMAKTLDCYDFINYDSDSSGKISFISSNMLTNKDKWDKKFELIEAGYDNPTDNNNYTKISDLKSNTIASPGFIFGNDVDCSSYGGLIYNNEPLNCSDFFDDETKNFIGTAYFYLEVIGILLTIGLTIMDYASAILNSDQDKMKKNSSKLVKRSIIVVIIILLPVLIRTAIDVFNVQGFSGDNDPLCGVVSRARDKVKK